MASSRKTMMFVCLLVAASLLVSVPTAQGQTIGGLLSGLISVLRIQGTIFCSVNAAATLSSNGTIITPRVTNATVQLRCGTGNGTMVASVQTNNSGAFSLLLDGSFFTLTQILSLCRVSVSTPLVGCNVSLPINGILSSTLTSVGNITTGLIPTVTNIVPVLFTLLG